MLNTSDCITVQKIAYPSRQTHVDSKTESVFVGPKECTAVFVHGITEWTSGHVRVIENALTRYVLAQKEKAYQAAHKTEAPTTEVDRSGGYLLRKIRENIGISMKALGTACDMSVPHVSAIERGEFVPTKEELDGMLNFLLTQGQGNGEKQ